MGITVMPLCELETELDDVDFKKSCLVSTALNTCLNSMDIHFPFAFPSVELSVILNIVKSVN